MLAKNHETSTTYFLDSTIKFQRYGSFAGYIEHGLGLSQQELFQLQESLLSAKSVYGRPILVDLWVNLLPVLLVMFISPARTLAVILLLHTPKRSVTAFAYVVGMIGAMMLQGVLLGFLMSIVGLTVENRGGDLASVVSILFVVTGIILLVGGSKFIFEDDDDKAPPDWFSKIELMSPSQGLKLGFGWLLVSPKQWVLVLTTVAVIFAAYLSAVASIMNFFIFTLLVQTVFFVIISIEVLLPKRSQAILEGLFAWLKKHLRALAIGIFIGFGLFFIAKGLIGLAG